MKTRTIKAWGVVHTEIYIGTPLTHVYTGLYAKSAADHRASIHCGAKVVRCSITYELPKDKR